jgi:hypothetical protein
MLGALVADDVAVPVGVVGEFDLRTAPLDVVRTYAAAFWKELADRPRTRRTKGRRRQAAGVAAGNRGASAPMSARVQTSTVVVETITR